MLTCNLQEWTDSQVKALNLVQFESVEDKLSEDQKNVVDPDGGTDTSGKILIPILKILNSEIMIRPCKIN